MFCALGRSVVAVSFTIAIALGETKFITPVLYGQGTPRKRSIPVYVRPITTNGNAATMTSPSVPRTVDCSGENSAHGSTVTAAQLTLPAEARTSFNNALKLFAKKDFDAARSQVVRALQICPRFAAALTLRGVLRVVGSQDQQAREDFRMALKIDPSYSLAYIGLAADYNLIGQFDQALNILRESAPFTARLWQSHFEASKALFAKGLFSRAIHEANQASLLYGRDMPDLHLIKAASYLGLKQNNDAIWSYDAILHIKRGQMQIRCESSSQRFTRLACGKHCCGWRHRSSQVCPR